ncbi:kelch-like protein 28 isoform X1 [Hemiscyllium ocellatum]|uniref:kelch-like protein 28 isoform X1 n=1 Tax=Hemiscyllium ocellatum TaxID=170820 RepID=UPI0029671DF6|nr:kelch-like protein 28 isoform X1 [Hemiscyllium ocellatum]
MDPSPQSYMLANLTHPHSEQLLQGLNLLRQHRELCDIVLRVGDVKIHAHKVVLASISPYFKAMFTGNLSENENSEVEFQCIDETALQAIVEYAYTGTIFISQDTVESLLPAANLLQIKLVLKECCTFLESQLDPGNCIGISRFAETYGCHDLYLAANKYICQNFEEVCHTEEFFELNHTELDEIISNDCLNVVTEESVFYALEAWIKYDVQERQKYLAQLLHCVRLPLLSVKFLTRLYEANQLIRDEHTCKHLLNEALKYHFMPEHRFSHQTELSTRPRCAPKVLCAVGGKTGLFATLDSVEMYFPQTDSWTGLAPLSSPRYECGVAVVDQKLYVVGGIATHIQQGINYRKHENLVEGWNPETNKWTTVERMNECRSTLGVAVLAGELYALGGYDGENYLQSVEKYIPKIKKWQPVAPMGKSRSCFAAAVLDGKLYAIGGYGPAHMNSVERYDPSKDSWEMVAPMADKRINFGVGSMLGFIFVVGGHNGVSHLQSVERYEPHQNQWTLCRPMSDPRTGVGAAIVDNYLYVVGGHSGSSYLNMVQRLSCLLLSVLFNAKKFPFDQRHFGSYDFHNTPVDWYLMMFLNCCVSSTFEKNLFCREKVWMHC